MRRAALIAVLLVSWFSVTLATSKSYDVAPFGNSVAEIVTSNGYVRQYYRNTLDSLVRLSWWCGDTSGGGLFDVEVVDSAIPTHQIAHNTYPGHPTQCWAWLNVPLTKDAKPVRGRTYKVVVSRPNWGGAISFGFDPRNTYRFGNAVANNCMPQMDSSDDVAAMVAA